MKNLTNSELSTGLKFKIKQYTSIIIILTAFGTFLFYCGVIYLSLSNNEGPLEPNVIGDTLGGTLSPIIGLISAILIYITIDQQIEANSLIQKQIENQDILKFEETIFPHSVKQIALFKEEIANQSFFDTNGKEINKNDLINKPFQYYLDFRNIERIINRSNYGYIYYQTFSNSYNIFKRFIKYLEFLNTNFSEQKAYEIMLNHELKEILDEFTIPMFSFTTFSNADLFFDLNKIFFYDPANDGSVQSLGDIKRYLKLISNSRFGRDLDFYEEKLLILLEIELSNIEKLTRLNQTVKNRPTGGYEFNKLSSEQRAQFYRGIKKAVDEIPEIYFKMKESGNYIFGDDPNFPKW